MKFFNLLIQLFIYQLVNFLFLLLFSVIFKIHKIQVLSFKRKVVTWQPQDNKNRK